MNFELLKNKALEAGIKEIELYESISHSLSISLFDEAVDQREESKTDVFAIRGVYNNQIATVYSENGNEDNIPALIDRLKSAAAVITKDDPFFIYAGDKDYQEKPVVEHDFKNHSTKEKIELMQAMVKRMREKTDCFFHAQAEYGEAYNEVRITNSNGLSVHNANEYATIVGAVVCQKNGEMKDSFDYKFIKNLSDLDVNEFSDKIVENAMSKFGADTIPSNSYKVVLQNDVVCDLIGVYKSIFFANAVKKKRSFLEGKLGEQVFGKNVTLTDDPFCEASPVYQSFDDEGVAARATEIVTNGKLNTYLHNLSTAAYYNTKSTGNGYKPSVKSGVAIDSTTLCLKAGKTSFADLLAQVGDGVLITSITGLHAGVNQISGDFNVQCSGYLIENGKKGRAVTLIILSGKFQEVFNNIKEVGSDLYYSNGIYAPSLYIESMNISGK